MAKQATQRIPVEPSSGNVFADLGLPDAEDLNAKVRLAIIINRLVAAQRLTQLKAAARLNVSQQTISALKNYRLDGFALERLLNFLLALDLRGALGLALGARIDPVCHQLARFLAFLACPLQRHVGV